MNGTITSIGTALNVQAPDLSIMSTSLASMNNSMISADILYAKTLYLPNVYERFKRINKTVVIERQRLGEYCARLAIDVDSKISLLRKYEQELRESTDPDEISDIQAECAYTLKSAMGTAGNEAYKLANALREMKEPVNRQQTQGFKTSIEQDIVKVTTNIDDTLVRLTGLKEERRVLSAAIDAIESKGFANIARDTLLTAEKVVALGVQPPQMEVIALAIEQMKATLEYGAEGINFIGMIKRRDSLRERVDKLSEQLAQKEKEKLGLAQRVELIGYFHTMDDQRSLYLEQYKKIVDTVDSFLAINKAGAADDEERNTRFISSGLQLTAYLRPIR
ncbi:alpha-xenorhabdolysin family binary toxin subunit B [Pseudomonas sp. NPDC089734]|uniref:alpha-xenorhabdolysin family binary toxin subunit B n=1 Tax=Pseudomonas sp. NPDC089734 TaxID=3364469 RepID=UPI00380B3816